MTTGAEWPQFGDAVENTVASVHNPQRTGLFVRVIRIPHGRMNAGTWWEITDGRGTFWQSNPEHCVPIKEAFCG